MNKLSLVVLLVVAVCSCYGISDRRSTRSASEVSAESNAIVANVAAPQDLDASKSADEFTGRGKNNKGGGNKHKMEVMHMGLSYIKMVISTLMAVIGHIFAFKTVGLALISVFIQIAQFIMTLKKSKEGHHYAAAPAYKVVETPWHTSPTESFGSYGTYGGGHDKASPSDGYYNNNASPYAGQPSSRAASRR